MRMIVKKDENPILQKARNKGWTWNDFHDKAQDGYNACREQALEEQNDECAYTGLWLGEGTTQVIHIDHYRKKALYPELTFNWNNLFAAAKDLHYGADYKDKKISGPKSNSDSQYDSFFSPLEANLENYFWYSQDGTIIPHPTYENGKDMNLLSKIRNTIDFFNLNADDLKHKRRGIIEILRGLGQLEDEIVKECMLTSGFSFLVDFELAHRKC